MGGSRVGPRCPPGHSPAWPGCCPRRRREGGGCGAEHSPQSARRAASVAASHSQESPLGRGSGRGDPLWYPRGGDPASGPVCPQEPAVSGSGRMEVCGAETWWTDGGKEADPRTSVSLVLQRQRHAPETPSAPVTVPETPGLAWPSTASGGSNTAGATVRTAALSPRRESPGASRGASRGPAAASRTVDTHCFCLHLGEAKRQICLLSGCVRAFLPASV